MSQHKTLIGIGWVCAALAFFPGYETSTTTRNAITKETTQWRVGISPLVQVETKHVVQPAGPGAPTDSLERQVDVNLVSVSAALALASVVLLTWGVLTRRREAAPPSSPEPDSTLPS